MHIDASGRIGSGVLFTGQTPPGGWDNFLAGVDDTDWPYHGHSDSERYCLIGRWEPTGGAAGDWFFVGNGRTVVIGFDPTVPVGTGVLRFAVNRPFPDDSAHGLDPGDGSWDVTLDVFDPDPGDTPDCTANPGPNSACMAITGTLDQMRIDAASMCEAITRTRGDRDATVAALWASVGALSGSVTALAVFAGVVVGAQAAISGAAAQAAAAALGPGAAAASVLALSAQIAGQIAAAGPAAVRGGWVTVIIFAILVALVIAALIWFIAELLEVIFRNNDLAIARSNFTGELAAIRSAIARAAMVCCEFDASLPACSDF